MSTATTLGRSTSLVAAGQAAVKSTQLVVALLLVRLLSVTAWNQVAFVLSIHLAIVTFGALGLQHGLLYFVARDQEHARPLLLRTAGITLGLGAVVTAVLWLLADTIGGSLHVASVLPIIGLAAALEVCTVGMPSTFVALQRFRAAALWDIANSVVAVGFVAAAAALDGTVNSIATALAAAALVRFLAFAVLSARLPSANRSTAIGVREQLIYSLPLGLTLAANVINRTLDKWYIAAFEPSQLGRYTIAAQEIPLLAVLPYAGGAVIATELARAFGRNDTSTASELWLGQTRAMARLVVPMTIALILTAPELLRLLVGSTSPAMVLTFQLFTAITLHRVAEYGLLLRVAGRPSAVLSSALVLLGANAVLALVGVLLAGPAGAAAGTLVANVVAWLFVLHRIGRALGTTIRHSFPWRDWSLAIAISGLSALAAARLASLAHSMGGALVVKATSFTALLLVTTQFGKLRTLIRGPRIEEAPWTS